MSEPDPPPAASRAESAAHLLECSEYHMDSVYRDQAAAVLAARAQAAAILAVAEAIEELTNVIREKCGRWLE